MVVFFLIFFSALILRNLLEPLSTHEPFSFKAFFLHYDISFIFLALALIILTHYATKEGIKKISKVILPSFFILILAPIFDLIISLGKGFQMTYLLPGYIAYNNLLLRFFTFFGPLEKVGITPGIRIEIGLALLGLFFYFFIKNKNFIKSIFFTFLSYSAIFFYLAMPFSLKGFLKIFQFDYIYSNILMAKFYLFLIFFLSIWLFYLYNRKYFMEVLKDIRPLRLLHFELMFVFGLVLGRMFSANWILNKDNVFHFIFIPISIFFAWLFSVIVNNLEDYEIDKISNRKRPLIIKTIPINVYEKIGCISFLFAIVFSLAVNIFSLLLILLFIGLYFLYSISFKKITFFSKLVISFNSLLLAMLGYNLMVNNLTLFPSGIVFFFLIFFTAAVNFIDIKDYEGDKHAGIKTLPVVLGLRKSKLLIGLFFLIAYLAIPFFLEKIFLLIPSAILGIAQFFLINKKNYNEKPVFLVYLFSLIILIVCFNIFKI